MKVFLEYLAIGTAGFVGAITRVAVSRMFGRWFPTRFPVGTLVINVTGSFILGFFLTYVVNRPSISDTTRLAIGAGFVGAYTTFSTLMYDSTRLADEGAGLQSMFNIGGSLLLGMLAVRFGIVVARWL